MVYLNEAVIQFSVCYLQDLDQLNACTQDQLDQFVIQNNEHEHENDTESWLQYHCPSMNAEDFIINDNRSMFTGA